jgi:hypothetical protein
MEKPVTLLPEPDSPTNPSTSPAPTSRSTPSTDFTTPSRVKKCVFRFTSWRVGEVTVVIASRLTARSAD